MGAGGMKSNHLEMVPYFTNTGIEKRIKKKTMKSNLATLPATVTLPPKPWEETEKEFGARLKAVASWANHHHDVEGLCKEMPQRMHDFVDHPSKNPRAGPAMA